MRLQQWLQQWAAQLEHACAREDTFDQHFNEHTEELTLERRSLPLHFVAIAVPCPGQTPEVQTCPLAIRPWEAIV
jgi:hypothetical protein